MSLVAQPFVHFATKIAVSGIAYVRVRPQCRCRMRGLLIIAACLFACGGPQSPPAAANVAPDAAGQPSTFVLSIVFGGVGDGRVRSATPGGLDCTLRCQATFAAGSVIDLGATAFPGSRFEAWD